MTNKDSLKSLGATGCGFRERNLIMFCGIFLRGYCNALAKQGPLFKSFHATPAIMVKIGDAIPSMELTEDNPTNKVNIANLCKGKKVVIFAVPGAFTPGCSTTHLPSYLKHYDMIKGKGIDEIICVSVNDAYVMEAWGKAHETVGKIRLLADANGEYTKALNLDVNLPPLGGTRSKRYSMIVENGIIKKLNIEPDGTGLTCSLADRLVF